jgi:hypothetical protein
MSLIGLKDSDVAGGMKLTSVVKRLNELAEKL